MFWLSERQLERIKPFFPKSLGVSRVDERKVLSGIIHVLRHDLRWVDAPAVYGPHTPPCNRFRRWSGRVSSPWSSRSWHDPMAQRQKRC